MAGEIKEIKDFTEQTTVATTDWGIIQTAIGVTKKIAMGLLEFVSNKSTSVATDQASNTKYPSVKAVYDWATGLFATLSTAQTLSSKQFTAYRETVATPSISAGVLTLDLSTANVFKVTHNANITTLTISNPPSSGISCCFVLNLTQDATGGRTITFPAACVKSGGTALSLSTTANKRNKIIFDTDNGGTTYDIALAGKDYA